VHAVPITVTYGDEAGQGFSDPALGAARRGAFEFAVTQWANTLAGNVPIVIAASMPALGGSGGSALLASAGPTTVHRDFSHALPDTWYGAALANELGGNDANGPDLAEIDILFNADVDGPEALGSIAWYYGTDAQPGSDVDFVTIALHELGHGLGFFEAVDPATGGWRTPNDQPAIFDRMLMRPQVGGFTDVRNAERLAAIISPPLLWKGANLIAFNGAAAAVFTPDPFQPGASISHWDPAAAPGELMSPSYSGPMHDPGLLLPALVDMGWQLAVPSPTPRATAAPPTSTPTATATPTNAPARTPPTRKDMVYVSNFDDATVSVIDAFNRRVAATIPVADGPLGVAATADGTRVYVADFHVGALSVISTRADRVLTTRVVGESSNAVAVTADGALIVVTDTAADQAVVIDAASQHVIARAPAGQQPSAVALGPDSRFAFIADYGEATIAVVDLVTGLRRGIIPIEQSELLGIAIAADTGAGFVAAFFRRAPPV